MNKIKLFLLLMMISLFSTLTVFAQTYVTSSDVLTSVKSGVIGISNLKPDRTIFSTGSAVIVDNINGDYYALTSYHIVHDQTYLEVVFEDKTTATASLVKTDFKQDLAMITFKTNKDLHQFIIKDYDYIKLGEPVYAIGNPLGYDYYGTVTSGIISNLSRLIDVDLTRDSVPDSTVNVLQHDASITSGNSGGALIDVNGNLIGINSFVKNNANDINFAIPSNTIIDFINISIPLNSISTVSDISDGASGAIGGIGGIGKTVCDWNGDSLITSDDYGQYGPPINGSYCQTIVNDYYPDEHINDTVIDITEYIELPYTSNGSVNITKHAVDDKYDLTFNDFNSKYNIYNVGLPTVYDNDLTYTISYKVIDLEGVKRIYIDFIGSDDTTIQYELTTHEYRASNTMKVLSKKLTSTAGSGTLSNKDWFVHFNTNIPIDDLYQADIEFTTYKQLLVKYDYEDHSKTIYSKDVVDQNIFEDWFDKLFNNEPLYQIEQSSQNGYDWQVNFYTGSKYSQIENLYILKLYYVTDGVYYETPDPTDENPYPIDGTPISSGEDSLLEKIEQVIDFITENKEAFIALALIIPIVIVAVPVIMAFSSFIKILSLIFNLFIGSLKIILSTLKLPLLLFKGKSKQVKYNQVKYKEFRR